MMRKKEKTRGIYALVLFTVLFVGASWLIFGIFPRKGISMVVNNDAWNQHIRALQYYSDWLQSIARKLLEKHRLIIPRWDLSIGYGNDVFTTLHYYAIGDPLTLLSVFVPDYYMVHFYSFMIIFRIYLAGIAFILLMRYCAKRMPGAVSQERGLCGELLWISALMAGAFIYIFSGYTIVMGMHHPFFLNALIYLPLMVLGVEKLLRRESPMLFVLVVCVSLMSNFYLFYLCGVNIVMYVLARLLTSYGIRKLRLMAVWIAKIAGYTVVGMAMGCIVFIPVLLRLKNGARNDVVEGVQLLQKLSFYKKLPQVFFSMNVNAGNRTVMGYSFVAGICLILLFIERKRMTQLKVLFIIMTAACCSPIAGRVFNGFAYSANRWMFGFTLLIAGIVTWKWNAMYFMKRSTWGVLSGALGVLVAYMLFWKNGQEWRAIGLFLLISVVLLTVVTYVGKRRVRCAVSVMLLGLTLLSVVTAGSAYLHQKVDEGDYLKVAQVRKSFVSDVDKSILSLSEDMTEFCRYSAPYELIARNSTLKSGLYSLHYYWSMGDRVLRQFFDELGVNETFAYKIRSLDGRTALDTLACVRYFVTLKDSDQVPPFGYEKTGEYSVGDRQYNIYENQYTLPFGYTYDSCISKADWEQMNEQEREYAMLQGVYLEEIPEGYAIRETEKSVQELSWEWEASDTVERNGRTFTAKKNGVLPMKVEGGIKRCETTVTVRGIEYLSKSGSGKASVKLCIYYEDGSFVTKTIRFLTSSHARYGGVKDYIVNLGWSSSEIDRVELIFPETGTYRMESIALYGQPMDTYASYVRERSAHTLQNVKFGADRITGSITLEQPQILCLSMTCSDGWSVYVDGEKRELLTANLMYMAVPLESGAHEVELRYRTPGYDLGMIVSLVGVVSFLGISVCNRKNHRNFQKKKL
ncbi:MAG: YfhO family protein [Eubacteriales bacterium]|nr:YfhO family protein [Eubacteriales bacterium]